MEAWNRWTYQAGWFWPEVAGQGKRRGTGGIVKRTGKVEKVMVGGGDEGDGRPPNGRFSDERVAEYEAALEKLGQEATDVRKGAKS